MIGCEFIYDYEPSYKYVLINENDCAIEVQYDLSNFYFYGKYITEEVPANSWIHLINHFEDNASCPVVNFEKHNKNISIFNTITIKRNDTISIKDFTETEQWEYRKLSSCVAEYSITVSKDDW